MSYTPTNWTTGDTITATKLNKLENGVANAGSALIVQWSNMTGALDKTVQEIYDAFNSGTPVYVSWTYGTLSDYIGHQCLAPVVYLYSYNYGDYFRIVANRPLAASPSGSSRFDLFASAVVIFTADSLSAYPSFYATVYTNNTSLDVNV